LEFVWHIEGHCQSSVIAALYAAKINNAITVPLLQQTAMLLTGWCHITLSPHVKNLPPPAMQPCVKIILPLVVLIVHCCVVTRFSLISLCYDLLRQE